MIILDFSQLAAIHFFENFLGDINIKNPPVYKCYFQRLFFRIILRNLWGEFACQSLLTVKESISLRLHFILEKVYKKILTWSKISIPNPSITLLIILLLLLNSNQRADFNNNLTIGKKMIWCRISICTWTALNRHISLFIHLFICALSSPVNSCIQKIDFLNVLNQVGRFMQIIRSKVETWVC